MFRDDATPMLLAKFGLLALAVFMFSTSFSQATKPFFFGFNGGLNASNQQLRGYDGAFGLTNRWRFALTAEKLLTHRLSLLSELSYAGHGSSDVLFTNRTEQLNYAELNVQAIEYLPVGGSDLFVSLGLYGAYGINGKQTGTGSVENVFTQPGYKRFDWGAIGNIGFKMRWGTYVQTGLKLAFNNCYALNGLNYYNFAVMATAGQTLNWQKKKRGARALKVQDR
jgi:hypothetical protein